MVVAQLIERQKSGRKPLQPKNPSAIPLNARNPDANPKDWIVRDSANKENVAPVYSTPVEKQSFPIEPFDASLAEELSAIREKLERLRADKEKTEEMLSEKALMLDLQMKEVHYRGQLQRRLEIEVDRLFRLKEIKSSCVGWIERRKSSADFGFRIKGRELKQFPSS